MKKCTGCGKVKDISEFSSNGKYTKSRCKPCNKEASRNQRRGNKRTFLLGKWAAMSSRVSGKNKTSVTPVGKPIINKEEFVLWGLSDPSFISLFDAWAAGGFNMQECPSIDRIDVSKGYVFGNMQFISFAENSTKDRSKSYSFVSPSGEVHSFTGLAAFCNERGLSDSLMSMVHKGKRSHHKGWVKNAHD